MNTVILIIDQLRWNLLILSQIHVLAKALKIITKILSYKLITNRNINIFLEKTTLQINQIGDREDIAGTFSEKELQKSNQTWFRIEKIDRLCVKWKTYDNLVNNRIDRKISLYKMSYYL